MVRNLIPLKSFYKEIKEQNENLIKKMLFAMKAQELQESTDFAVTTNHERIQDEWNTGTCAKISDKIWKDSRMLVINISINLKNTRTKTAQKKIAALT
jgi:hypothetical protein